MQSRFGKEEHGLMSGYPLFSVIVLCYRHFEYLRDAIDSVLIQKYPAIELIVSDDGSDAFPKEEIERFIEDRKGENVIQYLVRTGEQNLGTVKHLNQARTFAHGEYIVFLAGDDRLFDENVLSAYADAFSRAPKNCWIEMAQTGMFDEKLRKMQKCYMTAEVQRALEKTETDSSDLMRLLITKGACLPSTSTCFRVGFFERFGGFDESYRLVEDFPMHIRLAKEGWIIHCESFIAIRHRHGGISHGHKNALSKSQIMYLNDTKRMVQELQLGNIEILPKKQRKRAIREKKAELLWIDIQLEIAQKGYGSAKSLILRHPGLFAKLLWYKCLLRIKKVHKRLLVWCYTGWVLNPRIASLGPKIGVAETVARSALRGTVQTMTVLWCIIFVMLLIDEGFYFSEDLSDRARVMDSSDWERD